MKGGVVPGAALELPAAAAEARALAERLAFQRTVVRTGHETSLDAILLVSAEGKVLSYNQRFVELWRTPPEVIASGDHEAMLRAAMGRLTDPEGFLARVRYLYDHLEEQSRDELALTDGTVIERYSAPMADSDGAHLGRVWYFHDVTERRRAEGALREYRDLFAGAAVGVYRTTPDGRVLLANPALLRMLGYDSFEELEARNLEREGFEPAYPRAEFRARIERDGLVSGLESLWTRRDGTRLWVRERARAVRGPDGTTLYYDGMVEDITDLKRKEDELRRSEQRLRSVFDRMELIGLELDRSGRIAYCNDYFLTLTGWRREEVIGADFLATFLPVASPARAVFDRAMTTGESPAHFRNTVRTRDGKFREIAWNNTLLLGEAGVVTGVVSIGEDITEQQQAAVELQRSEAEFRGLIEHAPVGIYRATRGGRFLVVNPALVRMLGYGWPEELLQLDVARDVYANPAERERLIAESPHRAELVWMRKDGTPITVELTSHRIPVPEGAEETFEGVVVDVTQQRSLEAQFRQAQRLEAVGRLAGGVAHDFNNVLTAITGYTDLVLEDLGPEDPRRADVEEIKAAAVRAAALTRQLLAFSRKQVLQTRVLDLNEVLRTLERMLRRLIGEDVALELALSPSVGAVRADPGQIEQVILNLAVNSRDAMPRGGKLTIETADVDLDEGYAQEHAGAVPGPYVMVAVSDTGTGMDAETRSHVFEPFFTTKELGKGTGLGLATVYGIVKQSGGYIWVYSEPGRGATFKVYLPRVHEAVEGAAPAPAEPLPARRGETVLLAEDDPAVRGVVAEVLTQKGYRVLRAQDGQDALELARGCEEPIQLLLTDLVMPGMPGRELAETLAAQRPGLRVLYMSGYTDDAVVRHGVLDSGMAYLQKPFTPRALAAKVREVLDSGRP